MPRASAAAITSGSRVLPPGWTTAVAPAFTASSRPSGNGKNASLASAEPARSIPSPRAPATAILHEQAAGHPPHRRRRPSHALWVPADEPPVLLLLQELERVGRELGRDQDLGEELVDLAGERERPGLRRDHDAAEGGLGIGREGA